MSTHAEAIFAAASTYTVTDRTASELVLQQGGTSIVLRSMIPTMGLDAVCIDVFTAEPNTVTIEGVEHVDPSPVDRCFAKTAYQAIRFLSRHLSTEA